MWRLSYCHWKTEQGNGKGITSKRFYDCKGGIISYRGTHVPLFYYNIWIYERVFMYSYIVIIALWQFYNNAVKFLTICEIVKVLTLTMGTRLLRISQKPCIFPFKRVCTVSVGIYQRYNYSL